MLGTAARSIPASKWGCCTTSAELNNKCELEAQKVELQHPHEHEMLGNIKKHESHKLWAEMLAALEHDR